MSRPTNPFDRPPGDDAPFEDVPFDGASYDDDAGLDDADGVVFDTSDDTSSTAYDAGPEGVDGSDDVPFDVDWSPGLAHAPEPAQDVEDGRTQAGSPFGPGSPSPFGAEPSTPADATPSAPFDAGSSTPSGAAASSPSDAEPTAAHPVPVATGPAPDVPVEAERPSDPAAAEPGPDRAPAAAAPVAAAAPTAAVAAVRAGPPAASSAPTALLERPVGGDDEEDDEIVGLFSRTPIAAGSGPRVNLVPPEITTARGVAKAQRRGLLALLAVLLLVVGAYALVAAERSAARTDLAAAQQRTAELTAEQARYARAPLVYAEVDDTRAALASVMAGDVRWYQFLADLAVTSPTGLWLTSWQATASDPTLAAPVDPVTGLPAVVDQPLVASLTVSGSAANEPDVADWLDVLAATPGLTGSTASSLTRTAVGEEPVITFDSSASMTESALSERYTVEAGR